MEQQTDSITPTPVSPAPVAAGPEAGDDLEALRTSLAAQKREAEALQDRLLRSRAELENYKKRAAREKTEYLKFATEALLLDLLPVLDNLERAMAAARERAGSTPLLEGVEMTARLFRSVLERRGVKPIEPLGQAFDPDFHQAVAQADGPPEEANLVVEVIQKGYLLEGRVLRPAMVKVCRGAAAAPGDGAGGEGGPA